MANSIIQFHSLKENSLYVCNKAGIPQSHTHSMVPQQLLKKKKKSLACVKPPLEQSISNLKMFWMEFIQQHCPHFLGRAITAKYKIIKSQNDLGWKVLKDLLVPTGHGWSFGPRWKLALYPPSTCKETVLVAAGKGQCLLTLLGEAVEQRSSVSFTTNILRAEKMKMFSIAVGLELLSVKCRI